LEKFSELHGSSWKTLQATDLEDFSKGKSFGKGKGKHFGKSKGKGKGRNEQLALEDKKDEKTEEDESKDALKKARKARDSVASALNDLEEALGKASAKLSRQGKAAAEGWQLQLKKQLAELKAILSGKK
jgi:TATA-binding protein-associated factor Taf7